MPEAAIDEHHDMSSRKDYVRRASLREHPVDTEPAAQRVDRPSQGQLWLRPGLLAARKMCTFLGGHPAFAHGSYPADLRSISARSPDRVLIGAFDGAQ